MHRAKRLTETHLMTAINNGECVENGRKGQWNADKQLETSPVSQRSTHPPPTIIPVKVDTTSLIHRSPVMTHEQSPAQQALAEDHA